MPAPIRMCVGCGRTAAKAELARYVVRDGVLTADPSGSAPGRGTYTCRAVSCFTLAVTRKRFARALRAQVTVPDELRADPWRAAGEGRREG